MQKETKKSKTEKTPIKQAAKGTRHGDGGTYLIVYDDSLEFAMAAHYASRLAIARRGYVAIAHVTDLSDFMHWGKVEAIIRHDLRQQAEKEIWQTAKIIHDEHNLSPSLYIREGQKIDKILEIIDENPSIRALILVGSISTGNPGPLVSYFSGKGLSRLRVPAIILPGHLDKESINAIT